MSADLHRLLAPKSVAVIGATESANKPGRRVTEQLLQTDIRCYPVHPKAATVLGTPAYASIADVPEVVDVAVVAVAATTAVDAVAACASRGVPFVIVLAGGFGEAGEAGVRLEARLAAVVEGSRTRLLGPNTLGIQATQTGFDTVFVDHATEALRPADGSGLTFVSQSGSVAVEALGAAASHGLPVRAFIGLGNAVDMGSLPFVEYAGEDAKTSSLALYLEHLGEGRALLEAAGRVASRIPVFVLKAGRSSAGAAAVASHTGRLAGSDKVVTGALTGYGLQRAVDDEELIDAVRAVSYARLPSGNRVAIITPAGGYGVMGTDYLEESAGLRTLVPAQLAGQTESAIRQASLPFASTHNPVDVTAGADDGQFMGAVDAVLADPNTDIVIVYAFFAPPGITDDLIERLADRIHHSDKCVLVFPHAGAQTEDYCRRFTHVGVAAYPALDRVIRAARVLAERSALLGRRRRSATVVEDRAPGSGSGRRDAISSWLASLPATGPTEAHAKALLDAYGIATPERVVLAPDAPVPTPSFAGPYAVKVASAQVLHKTDAGALRLGVPADRLPDTVSDLHQRFPDADILVERMIGGTQTELIVGATRDVNLGPALMLGAGGILTELYRDVTFRLIPVPPNELEAMTDELTISALFDGFRGIQADRVALVDVLARVSALVDDLGQRFGELDVNPLCYAEGRWIALDAKIVLADR